jgi:hypothetical protein
VPGGEALEVFRKSEGRTMNSCKKCRHFITTFTTFRVKQYHCVRDAHSKTDPVTGRVFSVGTRCCSEERRVGLCGSQGKFFIPWWAFWRKDL